MPESPATAESSSSSSKAAFQHIWLPGRVPGLNELNNARMGAGEQGKGGRRWNRYSDIKRQFQEKVALCVRAQGVRPMEHANFHYLILEENRRRDPSNILAGAMKLVEDGLQKAGILPGDGWDQVYSIHPHWRVIVKGEVAGVFVVLQSMWSNHMALVNDRYLIAKERDFKNDRCYPDHRNK